MPRLDIETRRGQLIEAAIAIALRDGLDNTTVRRIAKEAGVSLGTVHYCFDSKRALLEAMVESLVSREVRADSVQFDGEVPPTPADAIRRAFYAYWEISGTQTEYQRLVYELVAYLVRQEDPGPELARRIFSTNYAIVERFIERFSEQWALTLDLPHEVVPRLVIALTDGVTLAWLADNDTDAAIKVLETFADLLGTKATLA